MKCKKASAWKIIGIIVGALVGVLLLFLLLWYIQFNIKYYKYLFGVTTSAPLKIEYVVADILDTPILLLIVLLFSTFSSKRKQKPPSTDTTEEEHPVEGETYDESEH